MYDVISYIMDVQQLRNDTVYSVRTQISLSQSLFRLIKSRAKKETKSLAALVRDSLVYYLEEHERKKQLDNTKLEQLANAPWDILAKEKGGWRRVKSPHRLIRHWREQEETRLKRLTPQP